MDKKPYKIVDRSGRNKCGIVASSLVELIVKAQEKFGIPGPIKVLLEHDGTLVDDESYFSTREPDTCFIILREDDNSFSDNTLLLASKRCQADHGNQDDILRPMNKQINFDANPPSESVRCLNCNNYHYNR